MKGVYNVGVIGCGYWGPNLIRNFMQMNNSNVTTIADLDSSRFEYIKKLYPTISPTKDYKEIVNDPDIDIVAIATPVRTHYRLAHEALANGKHVFIEKPITTAVSEAQTLISLAEKNSCKLMVGHTFLYTSAVRKMKQLIDSGELGDVYYINAQRLNLGLFQRDINVIWDLVPHDVSIIIHLLDRLPLAVSATGAAHINPNILDVATVSLHFENEIIAFIQCSWLDPDKIRRMTVVGGKKMMVYDDIQPSEKIRIFNKSIEKPPYYQSYEEFPYSYKYGDITIPRLDGGEPIRSELEHFIDCIREDCTPLSDGLSGLQVVRIIEAAQKSLQAGGQQISLNQYDYSYQA